MNQLCIFIDYCYKILELMVDRYFSPFYLRFKWCLHFGYDSKMIYLIKLQKLINSLTDAEFEQCMIEITKEFGKDYIFIHLLLHSSKLKNQRKEFYKRISNIIERLELGSSRGFRYCLNDMPSDIVATIAS